MLQVVFNEEKLKLRSGRCAHTAREIVKLVARHRANGQVGREEQLGHGSGLDVQYQAIAAAEKQLQIAGAAWSFFWTLQVTIMIMVELRDNSRAQHERGENRYASLYDMSAE